MLRGKNKLVCFALILVAAVPAAMSQSDAVRSVISTRQVADAMAVAGIAVNVNQIELLSGTSSTRENADVRVVSVTDQTAGAVKVKLRCQDNQECLPFYVLVHGLDRVNLSSTIVRAVPAVKASSPQNVIRGGDHATLILESPDSRMRLPVICLQSGVRGQTTRVASPDRRQLFNAEIIAPGILKGSL
jgi:flagella basal body P-ring formation protein FlgA